MGDKTAIGAGCATLLLWLAWVGFIIWVIYSVVNWLTEQTL